VLVGSSGVGKSSLLNALMPEALAPVGGLSDATGGGRHTTTWSRLVALPSGGEIIDTPGIREYGLVDVEVGDLAQYFPGFERAARCRFRDCKHAEEPGCGVVAAVDDDTIAATRYVAYRTLLDELENEHDLDGKHEQR
jgi:ribosome biogenesis GTPase / thiamine phosphate phosphatase